jgi:hypothetical protein
MKTLCLTIFLLSLAGVGDSAEYLPVKGKENPRGSLRAQL